MTRRLDDLVTSICGAADHPLAPFLRSWCGESRAFLAFAEAHAAKIRKKARLAPQEGERNDLLAELAVAAFLLRDRRFAVVYEPFRGAGQRGPDFQVTFRTHTPFHVEVTRLRLPDAPTYGETDLARRLARVLGDKIGQFPAGGANLLAVFLPPGVGNETLVPAAVRLLDQAVQGEADPRAPDPRPEAARAYQRGRQRLSAALLCSLAAHGGLRDVSLWFHPQAKHPLDAEIARYLVQKTEQDGSPAAGLPS